MISFTRPSAALTFKIIARMKSSRRPGDEASQLLGAVRASIYSQTQFLGGQRLCDQKLLVLTNHVATKELTIL